MTNIEKYTNTKDALDAYNSIDFKKVPFDVWLECEYEEPCESSLLEAASDAVAALAMNAVIARYTADGAIGEKIRVLRSAIAREKLKPVRNFDRFTTAAEAEEAYQCFRKMCDKVSCSECRFCGCGIPCVLAWLYEEAGKDVK